MINVLSGKIDLTIISYCKIIVAVYPCRTLKNYTSSPDESETRDVHILYNASLSGNMFTRYSSKVLNILMELTIGGDSETWIKVLKYFIKDIQEL